MDADNIFLAMNLDMLSNPKNITVSNVIIIVIKMKDLTMIQNVVPCYHQRVPINELGIHTSTKDSTLSVSIQCTLVIPIISSRSDGLSLLYRYDSSEDIHHIINPGYTRNPPG